MTEGNPEPPRPPRPTRPAAPPLPVGATAPTPARHARPAAPTARNDASVTKIDANIVPQGLSLADPGLSGIPALRQGYASVTMEPTLQRSGAGSATLFQTALPSCFVLGVTLPLLAVGWFTLDRFSVIRDNSLGLALPVGLSVLGVLFLGATALLWKLCQPAKD